MPFTRLHRFDIEYTEEKEYHSLKREIFTQHCYAIELDDPKRTQELLVFDIGAHIGLSTIYFTQQFPEAIVVALEPNPTIFPILASNLQANHLHHAQPFPLALTKHSGPTPFFIPQTDHAWSSNSSLLPKGWDQDQDLFPTRVEGRTPAEILTLGRQLAHKRGWSHPKVVWKLDVEGAERELLPLVLKLDPDVIITELHGPESDPRILTKVFEKAQYRLAEKILPRKQLQIITAYKH